MVQTKRIKLNKCTSPVTKEILVTDMATTYKSTFFPTRDNPVNPHRCIYMDDSVDVYTIRLDQTGKDVGILAAWKAPKPSGAYMVVMEVFPAYRHRGFGSEALKCVSGEYVQPDLTLYGLDNNNDDTKEFLKATGFTLAKEDNGLGLWSINLR